MESNFTLVGVVRAAESLDKRRAGFCIRGLKAHGKDEERDAAVNHLNASEH